MKRVSNQKAEQVVIETAEAICQACVSQVKEPTPAIAPQVDLYGNEQTATNLFAHCILVKRPSDILPHRGQR